MAVCLVLQLVEYLALLTVVKLELWMAVHSVVKLVVHSDML